MEEHSSGRNAWALRLTSDDLEQFNQQQVYAADAILLGRRTYEIWAAFWPTAGGDAAFAERMNEMPKFVASRTLKQLAWNNSTLLSGEIGAEIAALKRGGDGDILCYGSSELVAELVRSDLVDEYRLLLFPVILGGGKQLFRFEVDPRFLRLVRSQAFSKGVVLLTYEPGSEEPTSPLRRRVLVDIRAGPKPPRGPGHGARPCDRAVHRHRRFHGPGSVARRPTLATAARPTRRGRPGRGQPLARAVHQIDRGRSAGDVRRADAGSALCIRAWRGPRRHRPRDPRAIHTARSSCVPATSAAWPSTSPPGRWRSARGVGRRHPDGPGAGHRHRPRIQATGHRRPARSTWPVGALRGFSRVGRGSNLYSCP